MLYFNFSNVLPSIQVKTSKALDVPLIVTEQNPSGLGKTVQELDISHAAGIHSKTKFSMVVPEVVAQLSELCAGQLQCIVLFGMEVSDDGNAFNSKQLLKTCQTYSNF